MTAELLTTAPLFAPTVRRMCADLSRRADEVSAALDAALVNTQVDYAAPFDVNDTFAEAFEAYLEASA